MSQPAQFLANGWSWDNGEEVYSRGDGWVYARSAWYFDPSLVAPAPDPNHPVPAPVDRVKMEAQRLTRDWPTWREAWANAKREEWISPYLLKFWPVMLAVLGGCFFYGLQINPNFTSDTLIGFFALVLAYVVLVPICCPWTIYYGTARRLDPHKGTAMIVGALAATTVAVHVANKRTVPTTEVWQDQYGRWQQGTDLQHATEVGRENQYRWDR